jgi:multiple sugar transport system substrate-binding protein
MPTIKDVANLAGVSIGTVSNVLNGKEVREDLRIRVENAITELRYIPRAAARSLKSNRTNQIAIILPDLADTYMSCFLMYSESFLRENGYFVTLFLTNNEPSQEIIAIKNVIEQKYDGVILYSCQENKPDNIKVLFDQKIPVVFFENDLRFESYDYVGVDNSSSMENAMEYLAELGHTRIALVSANMCSSDRTLIQAYKKMLEKLDLVGKSELALVTEATKENGFKAMMDLIHKSPRPTAVIASNKRLIEGIFEAAGMNNIKIPEDLSVIDVSEKSWLRYSHNLLTSIERPVENIGRTVCSMLIDNISRPKIHETGKILVKSEFIKRHSCTQPYKSKMHQASTESGNTISIALLDCPASYAMKSLLSNFTNLSGINVSVDMCNFDQLLEVSKKELSSGSAKYDLFMVDIVWMRYFASSEYLLDITEDIMNDPRYSNGGYIEEVFDSLSRFKDRIYGLPFMPGTQILFYRKDLFEDNRLKQSYMRQYGVELKPPSNWVEFNSVARFFTKSYNGESPVLYGTTMAAGLPTFIASEFCPRKWAYKARAFDEKGNVTINSSEALQAVRNFVQSYSYAPPWSVDNNWDGEIDDFYKGKCAMLIQYESHSTRILNRSKLDMTGTVGYGIIPGASPVLGGWSLAINKYSKKSRNALKFIKWACSPEMSIPYSILGGTTAWKSYYKSSDLNLLYPWLSVAYKSYGYSRKRSSPYRGGPAIIPQSEYETILGEELKKVILGEKSPEECLKALEFRLTELKRNWEKEKGSLF